MGLGSSCPKPFPGDILEFPRNKYFSHFGVYYGERDGVPYVAHLTCRGLYRMRAHTHIHTHNMLQQLTVCLCWYLCVCVGTCFGVDAENKLLLFGRALKSEVKLDPLDLVGKKYKVRNMLDDVHPPRDYYSVVKPVIDDMLGRDVTFDILFHNSEHQATLFRYGIKKSIQIEKVYVRIVPTWKELFEKKKL
uniref:LRAT domain-containing protein n=1 Tax=Esox lucius TaxID=8010 RepID=A0A6Q2YRY2_ESOLU